MSDDTSDSPYIDTPSLTAVVLPFLAFVTVVLDAPCLLWHMGNKNVAASMLVGWVIVQNAITFLNAVIWPTDDIDNWWRGQIYCDIVIKVDFAAGTAISAATLCIVRALAQALDTSSTVIMHSYARRLRHDLLVYALTVGLPVYSMIAAFIIQSRRYYILAISGCAMPEWNSLLTVFLCYVPLVVLMALTCYYAVLVIVRLRKYKRELASVLESTQSGLSRTRFLRLLGLSLTLLFIYTPLFVYIIWTDVSNPLYPFDWNVVHNPSTFNTVILVQTFGHARIESWIRVSIGFVVFACFGFGKDIKVTYLKFMRRLGLARLIPYIFPGTNPSGGHGKHAAAAGGSSTAGSRSSATSSLALRAKRAFFSKLSSPRKSTFPDSNMEMMANYTISSPTKLASHAIVTGVNGNDDNNDENSSARSPPHSPAPAYQPTTNIQSAITGTTPLPPYVTPTANATTAGVGAAGGTNALTSNYVRHSNSAHHPNHVHNSGHAQAHNNAHPGGRSWFWRHLSLYVQTMQPRRPAPARIGIWGPQYSGSVGAFGTGVGGGGAGEIERGIEVEMHAMRDAEDEYEGYVRGRLV